MLRAGGRRAAGHVPVDEADGRREALSIWRLVLSIYSAKARLLMIGSGSLSLALGLKVKAAISQTGAEHKH